jgi:hypothetical protein
LAILLASERHERDGSWWAWVSWVQKTGDRHKVVDVSAGGLRPLDAMLTLTYRAAFAATAES